MFFRLVLNMRAKSSCYGMLPSEKYLYNYREYFTEEMLERKLQIDLEGTGLHQQVEDLPRLLPNYHKHQQRDG